MTTTCPMNGDRVNLLNPENFVESMPIDTLLELQESAPIYWWSDPGSHGDGFWVVTKYEDVVEVSRHARIFSSYARTALLERSDRKADDALETQRLMMLNMDQPEHTRLRSIVNKGFTPRVIATLREKLEERTERIITEALAKGTGNFVTDLAAELPLEAIAELLGVPFEERHKIFDWTNKMIGSEDPEYAISAEETMQAGAELYAYASELAAARRACPADDIVTKLIEAEVDGSKLTETEFEMFFLLLAVAGNETTRNAISHGMLAFFEHPDQWERFKKERDLARMAAEVVRWGTPVMHFQRTALEDTVLGGQEIKKGDRLGIYYSSANRDPDVFEDPGAFDITREHNPHVGFGGGGPHFCLGIHLANLEIEIFFNMLADRIPNITQTGDAVRLQSWFINGIKDLPVAYKA